jgi:hypothetical protein
MNVSIATVAKDVGTTVTGIKPRHTVHAGDGLADDHRWEDRSDQGASGVRDRLRDHGCGSLLTALSQSLGMLLISWSLLEGIVPRSSCLRWWRWSRPLRSG